MNRVTLDEDVAMTLLDALDYAARTLREHNYGLPRSMAEELRKQKLEDIQAARLAVRELRGR